MTVCAGLFTNLTFLPPHSKQTLRRNDLHSRPFYSQLLQILSRTHLFINVSCQLQDWQITVSGSGNSPQKHRCLDLFVVLINPLAVLRKKGPDKWPRVLIKPRRKPSRRCQKEGGWLALRLIYTWCWKPRHFCYPFLFGWVSTLARFVVVFTDLDSASGTRAELWIATRNTVLLFH